MSIHQKLSTIQAHLNAPKGQYNSFGKYHYRNCEDVLQALKPHLDAHKCHVVLTDEMVMVGNRIYVKATATFSDGENSISASAYARESESKKGMDDSQLTGATSSYARKYALNGLFAIDDNKDSDTTNQGQYHAPQGQRQAVTTLPTNIFANMFQALQKGVDKHGNPFTMQTLFDYLEKHQYALSHEQRQQLGV